MTSQPDLILSLRVNSLRYHPLHLPFPLQQRPVETHWPDSTASQGRASALRQGKGTAASLRHASVAASSPGRPGGRQPVPSAAQHSSGPKHRPSNPAGPHRAHCRIHGEWRETFPSALSVWNLDKIVG